MRTLLTLACIASSVVTLHAAPATTRPATTVSTTTAPATRPQPSIEITHATAVDPELQRTLDAIDVRLRESLGMTDEHTAVGLVDLATGRVAMLRPDRETYAASLPKVGILLAWFALTPNSVAALDDTTRHELGLMAKQSNNEMAAKFSRQLGLKAIQSVLNDYGLYDARRGGGLWVGKHYGKGDERIGSPVADNSHAATVRMLLRYFVLLEQDQLVSPEASAAMRELFRSPDLAPSDLYFVHALADRAGVTLYRKWGRWQDWHHDAAVITGPGRHYVLVALTHHPKGDAYLTALAPAIDDALRP